MIGIIGGGPVGCFAGQMLAKKGHKTVIIEEHPKIGEPVQCTGILTQEIGRIVKIPGSLILNHIKTARIHSNAGMAELHVNDLVIDRAGFDRWLAEQATEAGAELRTGYRFKGFIGKKTISRDMAKEKLVKEEFDKVIGCDGPSSKVAWCAGLYGERKFFTGLQATAEGSFNPDIFDAYVGKGWFGWVVPEDSRHARIGLMAKKANQLFPQFLKRHDVKVTAHQGGLIPLYSSRQKAYKKHDGIDLYLAGDAALHVKATTGGGIVPGLKAAGILAQCIDESKSYERALSPLRRELWGHRKIRDMLDKLEEEEIDELVSEAHQIRHVFSKADRDHSIKLLLHAFIAKPSLLRHAGKMIRI
jgi:digeranylgeranylglycerophospholipid reductase